MPEPSDASRCSDVSVDLAWVTGAVGAAVVAAGIAATRLWRDAIDAHRAQAPPSAPSRVLLHRDLHPLNVLWSAQTAAVVDWVNACVGHPHAELGHCRWNLAVTVGVDAADRFLGSYLELTDDRGYGAYDRWWDLDSLLDKVPGPLDVSAWHAVGRSDLTEERVAQATDTFLRSVV